MAEYIVNPEEERLFYGDKYERLIRCKDCKHWGADGYRKGCKYATCIMMENDYCSWAERKEE